LGKKSPTATRERQSLSEPLKAMLSWKENIKGGKVDYDRCWFEIQSFDGSRMLLTRDVDEFERMSETLSHLHNNISKFRIETDFRRSRIF
jgi:hypothetical protein